ncbi:MAG TPA: universal stress protein [Micromonosporaceae bacterium]
MIGKILVAVDDSPASLAGARLAVELAQATGATLHAVSVVAMGALNRRGAAVGNGALRAGREHTADTLLRYIRELAGQAGVPLESAVVDGQAAGHVLDRCRSIGADLIVLGRSDTAGPGQPYVGSQTRHVLEFADVPVLVVPPRR